MTASAPTLAWPPAAADARLGLVRIETAVTIAADRATVHAFATNAARWRLWHPATRAVAGVPDRPLVEGETIVEHIAAAGRRFAATWSVLVADAPRLWVIATDTPQGLARISYRLTPTADGGTHFLRTLECRSKGALLHALDPLLLRLALVPQSRRALDRLKQVIEADVQPARPALRGA